ncbi:MAG: hypothetical protein ACOH2M_26545 [Cypionkella sp.]
MNDSPDKSRRKRQGRSAVSNGTRMFDGVDGRSPAARRFRDLVAAYCTDLGRAYEVLSEAERNTIRQAATCQLQSETLQAALVRGEKVETDQLVRLARLSMNLLRTLGLGGPANNDNDEPDLDAFLAGRGAA